MARPVNSAYADPLDEIWVSCARRIGFTVARTRDTYARTDGLGTIFVGEGDLLDADDCLAQMVLHELCHALVEGEAGWRRADWGLDNQTTRDEAREHACLRLQAALTAPHGVRRLLAATTEYRGFYDALPEQAVMGDALAEQALARSRAKPFAPHLEEALAATARIAVEVARVAGPDSLWSTVQAERHPTGLAYGPAERTCGGCAWWARGRCRRVGSKVAAGLRACARWEAELDCQTCGACCREAYHSVTVSRRDPVVRAHPDLIVHRETYLEVRRDGERCAALAGPNGEDGRYHCEIYADRPRTCRDFTRGSANCLDARLRVGLSP